MVMRVHLLTFQSCRILIGALTEYVAIRSPGALIAIVSERGTQVLASMGYAAIETRAPISKQHRFRIASLSKLFTSIAVMQLHERKRLNIYESLSCYLPWFHSSKADLGEITPWHLLTHSSGLTRESGMPYWNDQIFPSVDQLKQYVSTLRPTYEPEYLWKYSNLGMSLLGCAVSEVSGVSFDEYLRQQILTPLGMNDTLVSDPGAHCPLMATGYSRFDSPNSSRKAVAHSNLDALTPAGGLTSTIEDLAKFLHFNLAPSAYGILNPKTLREMHRVQWLDPSWGLGIGLGFLLQRVGNQTLIGHGGHIRGFRSHLRFSPERQLGVIVLVNCDFIPIEELSNKCFELLLPSLSLGLHAIPIRSRQKSSIKSWVSTPTTMESIA